MDVDMFFKHVENGDVFVYSGKGRLIGVLSRYDNKKGYRKFRWYQGNISLKKDGLKRIVSKMHELDRNQTPVKSSLQL